MKERRKKDLSIVLIAVLVVAALIAMVIPIASPIIEKNRFETYREDLTKSFSDSAASGIPIEAEVDGETIPLNEDASSWLYSLLLNFGMGNKVKDDEDYEIRIAFPDGAELGFSEREVTKGARAGRMGLLISFKNSGGKKYAYLTDLGNLKSIRDVIQQNDIPD